MTMIAVIVKEARYRWRNLGLSALAVTLAVAAWTATVVLLKQHDLRTGIMLEQKEKQLKSELAVLNDDMRKAALQLSFNLLILPEGQDLAAWHAAGEIKGTMPQDYVQKLATGGIVTVRHFLPIIQKRILWEEQYRRIILVGSKGEVPNMHMSPKKPLVQPVPPETIVLGYELHRARGLEPGDEVTLMGHTFRVHRCHEQRGNQDDITAWIYLDHAQELFDMQGRLHAILALECLCAGMPGVEKFRAEVGKLLPQTDVVEFGTKALARAEARLHLRDEVKATLQREEAARTALKQSRERVAAVLVPVVLLLCGGALAALATTNAAHRQREFATLRSIGVGAMSILSLVLVRYGLAAIPGALAGCAVGVVAGNTLARWLDPVPMAVSGATVGMTEVIAVSLVAVLATLCAAWLPALLAARKDPAVVLGRE